MKKFLIPLFLAFILAIPAVSFSASQNIGSMLPQTKSAKRSQAAVYSGNVKSMKYHNQFCEHFDCKSCTRRFKSAEAAQKAGFEPCGKCGV